MGRGRRSSLPGPFPPNHVESYSEARRSWRSADMEPRLSLVTLGVSDLARARKFYAEGLGLPLQALEYRSKHKCSCLCRAPSRFDPQTSGVARQLIRINHNVGRKP